MTRTRKDIHRVDLKSRGTSNAEKRRLRITSCAECGREVVLEGLDDFNADQVCPICLDRYWVEFKEGRDAAHSE